MTRLLSFFQSQQRKPCHLVTWELLLVLFSLSLAILIAHFLSDPPSSSPREWTAHLFRPLLHVIKGVFGFPSFVLERICIVVKYGLSLFRSIPIVGDILEVIWWIITAPFRFIGWLFTKEPVRGDTCHNDGSCAELERQLHELDAKATQLGKPLKDSG
jgi:hypothetical protein